MSKKLLRKKLALMLANLKKKRPFYTELEFLESTGTQYIDTQVFPVMNTIKLEIQAVKQTGFSLFGSYETGKNFNLTGSSNKNYLRYASSTTTHYVVSDENKVHTFIADKGTLYVDGVQQGSTVETITGTSINSIALYARLGGSNNNQITDRGSHKIYYCKIWNNGSLVRDMIPVLDWDMTPCMYDKVSGELFYNQGTGDFIAGRQIHPVEYIESTGTQYIDTGVREDTICIINMQATQTTNTTQVVLTNTLQGVRTKWFGTTGNTNYYSVGGSSGVSSVSATTRKECVVTFTNMYSTTSGSVSFYFKDNPQTVYSRSETVSGAITLTNICVGSSVSLYPSYVKLFGLKIYNTSNVLLRDFIPAISEDGTAFLFDQVSHTCFLNAGTGAFAYPPVELEYIETDGTSYINTGYTPSGSTETEITTMLKSQNTSRFMFGCRTAAGQNIYACLAHSNNRIGYRVGDGGYLYSNGYNELNTKHTYKIANGVFYRDDEVVNATCEGASVSPNSPLALLTINTDNVLDTEQTFIGNFYSCTMKENNTLVRDFIPCYKDGQAGMWDKVNEVFYPSASGSFVAGAIVEPEYE